MWFQGPFVQSKVRQDPRWLQLESLADAAVRGNQAVLTQITALVTGLRTDLRRGAVDAALWTLVSAAVAVVCEDDILEASEDPTSRTYALRSGFTCAT